jgi:hypothetical protein
MSSYGPAQLDLIRRYARTLREMHADAMAVGRTTAADREGRIVRPATTREPLRQTSPAITDRPPRTA